MSYEVRTAVYEGPLDLLLQLITSHRLEVTELRLSDLVTEYLAHLDLMRTMDLEVTSEFLVIAATLIQLKARRLLPGDADVDLDEDLLLAEERDRLLARLLANLTFKDVAAVFALRFEATELLVAREVGPDPGVAPPPRDLRIGVGSEELHRIAERVLRRLAAEPDLDHLDLELPSVSAAIADLRRRLDAEIETDFYRITAHLGRPIELVAYFLAVLELARWGLVEARQADHRAPIVLRRTTAPAGTLVSEWDT
ncbi:MAG: segregation/condensation protein A [Acidimicrobiia bacterium]|nr:segregation/condensation protein A [Acidimicrobiia bacterium]